jgi:membrane protein
MGDSGEEVLHLHPHPQTQIALETYQRIKELIAVDLAGITLEDLVNRCQQETAETVV